MGYDTSQESDDVLSEFETCLIKEEPGSSFIEAQRPEIKKHKCTFPECNAAFSRPSRLTRHIRSHTGEKPYKCKVPGCDKAYTNSSHLKRHVETHNAIKTKYECSMCSMLFDSRHSHNRHFNRVHKKVLSCKQCNASFTKRYHLEVHRAEHSDVGLRCSKCDKKFLSKSRLKRHEETHITDEEKRYPCTISGCNEIFGKWHVLCAHVRTQHVIEYKCNECDKVFLAKRHLRYHSQVHKKDRKVIPCPYDKCPRVYYYTRNLDIHIRTSHLGNKFECDICKIKITTKQRLADHITKLHMTENRIKKVRRSQRGKRKDAGCPKKSMVSTLSGIALPPKLERLILSRKIDVTVVNVPKK